MTKKKNKPT